MASPETQSCPHAGRCLPATADLRLPIFDSRNFDFKTGFKLKIDSGTDCHGRTEAVEASAHTHDSRLNLKPRHRRDDCQLQRYWTELATEENTLLALEPISRMVPTTMTKITASITAYSAMSCPSSCRHRLIAFAFISCPPVKSTGWAATSHPEAVRSVLPAPRTRFLLLLLNQEFTRCQSEADQSPRP